MDNKDMSEELKNLKVGEMITFNISNEISESIQYLSLQIMSYENLCMSYLNNTCEEASKMNVCKFFEKGSEPSIKIELLKQTMLKEYLGMAYEYFVNNSFSYNFDYLSNKLRITKMEGRIS